MWRGVWPLLLYEICEISVPTKSAYAWSMRDGSLGTYLPNCNAWAFQGLSRKDTLDG